MDEVELKGHGFVSGTFEAGAPYKVLLPKGITLKQASFVVTELQGEEPHEMRIAYNFPADPRRDLPQSIYPMREGYQRLDLNAGKLFELVQITLICNFTGSVLYTLVYR